MDIWDKKKRSEVMSKIRSKNTKPEILLRKALFAKGYRYRIYDKKLPGKPDVVLSKYKTAIFVHGCFWHGHEKENCKFKITPPRTNIDYWNNKIKGNKKRDNENVIRLSSMGWQVIIIWECEIKKKNMQAIVANILNLLEIKDSIPTRIRIYEEVENEIVKVAEEVVSYSTFSSK